MDGRRVLEIYQRMVDVRGDMPDLWDEVIHYCFPQEHRTYSSFGGSDLVSNGERRTNPVCSYPVVFTQRLGSAIHANAFPSNDHWFQFTLEGEGRVASNEDELKDWCRLAKDITHYRMRYGTNFYQESHALMVGLAALGTGAFYTYWKDGGLKFRYIPIHQNFYIDSNPDGEIDMAAVLHSYTAKEAIQEYGRDKVSPEVVRSLDSNVGTDERFDYVQLIYPKQVFGEKYATTRGGKPYGDITVEKRTGNVVAVAQHGSFPFATPRFLRYGNEVYGRSAAMNAMPEIKVANALRKNLMDATARSVSPAIFINSIAGRNVSVEAGAVNYIPGLDQNSVWNYPSPTNFPVGKELLADVLESLKGAFYIDVFQAIEQGKYMTATEVTERTRQKVESIAPIVTRIQKEFSERVVLRCLDLLIENGVVPPPPLRDGDERRLKITFVSSLDAMLQQGIAAKAMNFVNQLGMLGQTVAQLPDLNNILNVDAISRALGDANTLPATFFRTQKETDALRQQQAQAAAAAQQAEVDAQNARSSADNAKASLLSMQAAREEQSL